MSTRNSAITFINGMKTALDDAWRGRGKPAGYTAATVAGCMRLYDLCVAYNPDVVLDIGTGAGASAMTLALAMVHTGAGAERVTTIGDLRIWLDDTLTHVTELAQVHGLNLREIDTLQADFNNLNPEDFILSGDRLLIFYDIHDWSARGLPSHELAGRWFPRLSNALVLMHDVGTEPFKERASAAPLHGRMHYGYPEINHVIPWIEENKGTMTVYNEAIIGALEFVEGRLL